MPWNVYLLQFVAGLLLANGVPHFVQGISGRRFQSPFASPPGVGESSPVVNVLWGFGNLAVGFATLGFFEPNGSEAIVEWAAVGLGALVAAVTLASHFGRVRSEGPKRNPAAPIATTRLRFA
ncbi:MAG: hypothetical protein ABR878_01190 [Roseiarcus sp.]|jgi:hypothetical protein